MRIGLVCFAVTAAIIGAVWAWLGARYPAATVSPLTLLVPIFGMGASALVLGEPLENWKIFAGLLVMGGLALNLFWARRNPSLVPVPETGAP